MGSVWTCLGSMLHTPWVGDSEEANTHYFLWMLPLPAGSSIMAFRMVILVSLHGHLRVPPAQGSRPMPTVGGLPVILAQAWGWGWDGVESTGQRPHTAGAQALSGLVPGFLGAGK